MVSMITGARTYYCSSNLNAPPSFFSTTDITNFNSAEFKMNNKLVGLIFFLHCAAVSGQELFPNTEPASNVPKGVLGVRVYDETYKEFGQLRNMVALKLMYGVLPKLTFMATVVGSNHHDVNFPANLVSHTHNGNQSVYSTGNFQRGASYPFLVNGIYLYTKYRFLTTDKDDRHLRMAAYAEWSNVDAAHEESEPTLQDDTKGYGGGLIITNLYKRLAISFTGGFIIPGKHEGFSPDLSGGPLVPTDVQYGRALNYDLSFGYLIYPFEYTNYNQPNINIYLELMGKSYGAATVHQYGDKLVPIQTPLLQAGSYVEAYPGVQVILKSNLRLDFCMGFPLVNQSLTHFYPVYMLGVQRYFFFKKRSKEG